MGTMDFKNGAELLAICKEQSWPISRVMRQREEQMTETPPHILDERMAKALSIMRSAATTPIHAPKPSMSGLIGGEAQKLSRHLEQGLSILSLIHI